jgi:hypothetical protein
MALREDLDRAKQENVDLAGRLEVARRKLEDYERSRIQLYISYAIGVAFALILLYLAIGVSEPTRWQYTIFRTILSLSAAGIAALLPGDIEIKYKNLIRATGALAVFFVVYKINPAELAGIPEPNPTTPFSIKLLTRNSSGVEMKMDCFTLPYSDVVKATKENKLPTFIAQYMDDYAHNSIKDKKIIYMKENNEKEINNFSDIIDGSNNGVIGIDESLISEKASPHVLFTLANTSACEGQLYPIK